jgi:D-alanine-D-alanine ligase
MAKHVIRDLGVPTPDFAVVDRIEEAAAVDLPYPLFAKPVAEGTSKGIAADSKISSLEELQSVCRRLLTTYRQSVLVEVFLPGREFTVGVVGTGRQARCVGVLEVTLKGAAEPEAYSYSNKVFYEDRVQYRLAVDPTARKAAEVALAAWRGLGCRDGGRVDLRCAADGSVHFIEVNPLAGLNPVWSDLPILCRLAGMEYVELIDAIMRSALDRVDRKGEDNVA